jgi:hypothetical protein
MPRLLNLFGSFAFYRQLFHLCFGNGMPIRRILFSYNCARILAEMQSVFILRLECRETSGAVDRLLVHSPQMLPIISLSAVIQEI